jgi:hypothetical protein
MDDSLVSGGIPRCVFALDGDEKVKKIFNDADAAHAKWQTDGSSYWECCDQILSGKAEGSRYYPRIITSALWMEK